MTKVAGCQKFIYADDTYLGKKAGTFTELDSILTADMT